MAHGSRLAPRLHESRMQPQDRNLVQALTQMQDLKQRAIRGGLAKVFAQAVTFVVRIGSLMILARLLEPKDFGLVAMVTAVTGVLSLFRDFGLSTATVQRSNLSEEQISTLFWINVLVGAILTLTSIAIAPLLSAFYHEPKLMKVTLVLSASFIINSLGIQHGAMLQREMRFTTLSLIDVVSLLGSTGMGILMAFRGYSYWSLVAIAIGGAVILTAANWLVTGWIPGLPRKNSGIRSIMRFGSTITLNGLVVYVAYNLEKVLLGRFWGPESLGIYGRGYQLANLPTENLNSAVGGVAFSALSRVQGDPARFKSYFLKAYSLVVGLTVPITFVCAVFAKDLIPVLLGPKWLGAAPILQILAPTILIFALINPLSWLLFSLGLVGRSLKIALVLAPLVIGGYLIGLSHGPKGVAFAYSAVMVLWVVPHIAWCVHGTVVSLGDIARVVSRPLIAGVVATVAAVALQHTFGGLLGILPRLAFGVSTLLAIYCAMLLWVLGQHTLYANVIREMKSRSRVPQERLASA